MRRRRHLTPPRVALRLNRARSPGSTWRNARVAPGRAMRPGGQWT